MSSLVVWTLLLTSFLPETFGYAVDRAPRTGDNRTTKPLPLLQPREDGDPTDYSWVKSLAAIGDSFTAGIGAGKNVGGVYDNKKANGDRDSYSCSRYDLSYPMLVNRVIGPSVKEFQFPACSGDRSGKIFDQVNALKENIDMVVMTAGGNDLCLAAMIRKCVILPYGGEETCNAVIKKAEENIDKILKDNIKQILIALNDKMAEGGVVVYNGYAQYFNTETNDCADKQHWEFARWLPIYWFQTPLRLTIERRERFNKLVRSINTAIREALYTLHDEGSLKYEIGFSNWDPWVRDGVNGQMCDPSSSGKYPDSDQPDLQFFKPSTNPIAPHDPNQLRRRQQELDYRIGNRTLLLDKDGVDPSIYDTLLWKSPAPAAEVLHKLDKRAPAPPGCPGDGDIFSGFFSNHISDDIGRLFHPNELGHETIASFALAKGIDLRAKVLDQAPQACDVIVDDFKCWQNEGRTGYATSDRMNENIEAFCSTDISVPDHEVGWRSEATYHEGTPDEHTFVLQMGEDVGDFDIDRCRESFDRIVNSCDGNDPENPMNWKFGGKWQRDSITYEINVKRDNRPWPPIKEPWGKCKGDYKALFGSYSIQGAGFSSWEWGQKTLLSSARSCVGGGITNWKFEYFDQPDEDGNEWSATFRTPIWVRNRCFKNNKVAFASGGFTNGCKGSD